MSRTALFGFAAVATALYVWREGMPSASAAEWVALALLLALIFWLTSPRRDAVGDATGGHGAGEGFALRLGKALNRIRRRRRRL